MKKNILITVLVITNAFTGVCLLRASWLRFLWRLEATTNSEFAAGLWASDYFGKGKLVRLRLKIEEQPQGYTSRPTEMDGDFVVLEQTGYSDPFPVLGGRESPSIQIARIMVTTFNERMQAFHEHPEKWQERRAKEIDYWQREVLGRRAANANAH